MGFSTGYKSVQNNRSLQKHVGGKFSRGNFELGAAGDVSEYNLKFDKVSSKSQIEKKKEQARAEVRKDRLRSFFYMGVIAPIVIWILWSAIKYYLFLLSLG